MSPLHLCRDSTLIPCKHSYTDSIPICSDNSKKSWNRNAGSQHMPTHRDEEGDEIERILPTIGQLGHEPHQRNNQENVGPVP
jgi:hypothetical protein